MADISKTAWFLEKTRTQLDKAGVSPEARNAFELLYFNQLHESYTLVTNTTELLTVARALVPLPLSEVKTPEQIENYAKSVYDYFKLVNPDQRGLSHEGFTKLMTLLLHP